MCAIILLPYIHASVHILIYTATVQVYARQLPVCTHEISLKTVILLNICYWTTGIFYAHNSYTVHKTTEMIPQRVCSTIVIMRPTHIRNH